MKETIIIIGVIIFVITLLVVLTIPAVTTTNENIKWCEENGGTWLTVTYNSHCAFPPK